MNSVLSKKNESVNALGIDLLKLKSDFGRILLLVSDLCKVSDAFITLESSAGSIIPFKIGLDGFSDPSEFSCFRFLIENNRDLIVSDEKNDLRFQNIDEKGVFKFFAGFPINYPSSCLVGTICILNKEPKELSSIELRIIKHALLEIGSLLQLHIENKKLEAAINQKEDRFQLFAESSKEIFFQLDLDGNFTFISKNWTLLLGHSENVLGDKFAPYIHTDDVESCFVFLNDIQQKREGIKELVFRIKHKEGYFVWFAARVNFVENEQNPYFLGAAREITKYVESKNQLNDQKEFYEKILNQLPTDVAVFDPDFKYRYLNPQAIQNADLRKFIIGKDDFEYAKHTNRENTFAIKRRIKFEEAILNKQTIEWEDSLSSIDGQITYHSRKITPVFKEDGSLEMFVGFGVDITKSKKIQEEILKSKQMISNIMQNVAVGILVQGPKSEILENNLAACEMLGLSEDQLLGKTSFDLHWKVTHLDGTLFKSDDHPVPQAIQQLKPINNVVMGVHRPVKNDLVWLLVDAIPVFGDDNELLYVICSFNDITIQKNAEDALKISNERFIYSGMATSDAIWDWDIVTGEATFGESFNSHFGHQFESSKDSAIEYARYVHPDDIDSYKKGVEAALAGSAIKWFDEYRYLKSDGTYAYVKNKAIIIRDANGNAIRMIGAMQDITFEKSLKDELLQSEAQFRGAFKYSSIGMAIINFTTFKWELVNSKIIETLGYTLEELNQLTFADITHPEDKADDLANLVLLINGFVPSYNKEKRYIHKNGSIVWADVSVSLVRNNFGDPMHFISQIIDITTKKIIEKTNQLLTEEINLNKSIQLKEAKSLYRLLADNMVDLVCMHSLDGTLQYVSPSIHHILGYTSQDLIGLSPLEFVHPDDYEKLQNSIQDFVTEKEDISAKVRFRNKKGDYVWCEIKGRLIEEDGVPVSFHSSTRDITLTKEAEFVVEKTLQQERELNELRTNLVSTISHEFRTPMTTIRASAELIMMYLENQKIDNFSLLQKRINTITGEIDRIVELMNTVLIISKNDSGKTNFSPIILDLKQTCLDVIEVSHFDYKDDRKVKTFFEGDSFLLYADKNLMEYILFNLFSNAFKYSKGSGDVLLNLFTTKTEIIIEIIDSGIGIPEKDQIKLFNTFFRASNTNGIEGTGLGLYIVKTFTERNSGLITIESELGKGTKARLEFPRHNIEING